MKAKQCIVRSQKQGAVVIDTFKRALDGGRSIHMAKLDRSADAIESGPVRREHVWPHPGVVQLGDAFVHPADECAEYAHARYLDARRIRNGRCAGCNIIRENESSDIYADADNKRPRVDGFYQDATEFPAVEHEIVWPLDTDLRQPDVLHGFRGRKRGSDGEHVRGAGVYDHRAMEAGAPFAVPPPSEAPASLCLQIRQDHVASVGLRGVETPREVVGRSGAIKGRDPS